MIYGVHKILVLIIFLTLFRTLITLIIRIRLLLICCFIFINKLLLFVIIELVKQLHRLVESVLFLFLVTFEILFGVIWMHLDLLDVWIREIWSLRDVMRLVLGLNGRLCHGSIWIDLLRNLLLRNGQMLNLVWLLNDFWLFMLNDVVFLNWIMSLLNCLSLRLLYLLNLSHWLLLDLLLDDILLNNWSWHHHLLLLLLLMLLLLNLHLILLNMDLLLMHLVKVLLICRVKLRVLLWSILHFIFLISIFDQVSVFFGDWVHVVFENKLPFWHFSLGDLANVTREIIVLALRVHHKFWIQKLHGWGSLWFIINTLNNEAPHLIIEYSQ